MFEFTSTVVEEKWWAIQKMNQDFYRVQIAQKEVKFGHSFKWTSLFPCDINRGRYKGSRHKGTHVTIHGCK